MSYTVCKVFKRSTGSSTTVVPEVNEKNVPSSPWAKNRFEMRILRLLINFGPIRGPPDVLILS